jgi:FixJ family two-component response regulator
LAPEEFLFNVHVIDDDDAVRDSLYALLTIAGYAVTAFDSAESFLAHLDEGRIGGTGGCVLLDLHMPGMSGLELLKVLVSRRWFLPVLLLTAGRDNHLRKQALDLGAVDCLTKPVPQAELLTALERVKRRQQSSPSQ